MRPADLLSWHHKCQKKFRTTKIFLMNQLSLKANNGLDVIL